MKLSPMMQQYMEIKEAYKECILFFRLGDFYEMFFDDAINASRELELTLTGKNCGLEERAPMCGVPFHSAETYISRLVDKGYKVAICEQVEDPALTKGLVKREVIQIVTPGTLTSQNMLSEKENNYLASLVLNNEGAGISYCDISTGEIYCTEIGQSTSLEENVVNELVKIGAREILANEQGKNLLEDDSYAALFNCSISQLNDDYCSMEIAEKNISNQFNVLALTGIGLEGREFAVKSLGNLLSYLTETQKQSLNQITHLNNYEIGAHMVLDKATIRNLELTENLHDHKITGSLLSILDKTKTAMGSRKMKRWLREPLNTIGDIRGRLDAVEELTENNLILNNIRDGLRNIYDFHRLAGRIASGNANGKDLIALRNSIGSIPDIKDNLTDLDSELLSSLNDKIDNLSEVYEMIDKAIVEDPPFTIKEGGVIKDGYFQELDDLKFSISDAKNWISDLEGNERERTGIKNLKVGYNKVFGYYLEVTKSAYELVPDNYIRKQTLVNAERFITPELKEMEGLVLNAKTKIDKMEYDLFTQVRNHIQNYIKVIQDTADAISEIDVLASFAQVSINNSYCKPEINDSMTLEIIKGRHPVIEQTFTNGVFVSNNTYMNGTDSSMLLITGPNMAGKSTYMRQTAIIVLMAQIGCFVPCERASIGITDRIFTRIGASDNLSQGQSTFFVEMSELAYILNSATERSLVILDEIGRGTSTYDGLSIAWAVVEHMCNDKNRIRTLFATHYHELTVLSESINGIRNMNVDVAEENGNIVFLHKIVDGSASKSYGIHVAKLAGVPSSLLKRASEKLEDLESNHGDEQTAALPTKKKSEEPESCEEQISMFSFAPNPVLIKLQNLNLMEITPSKAFEILEELKEAAEKSR